MNLPNFTFKATILLFVVNTASIAKVESAVSQINLTNTSTPITDNAGNALSSGLASNGDGFQIEVGYFSTDTSTFAGTWTAITGSSSTNPGLLTTFGDTGDGPDGFFRIDVNFDDGVTNTANGLPIANSRLAIRFYNSQDSNTATEFNTVTSDTWLLPALLDNPGPSDKLTMSLNNDALVWQFSSNAFRTVPIPEPSSSALLGLGGLALMLRRRRG